MENTMPKKQKYALFTLRAVIAFILLALLLGVLYWFGLHGYREVAEWGEPGDHSTLVYENETYELVGVLGQKGLTTKKYPIDKILGKVHDDGLPKLTEAPTEPETDPDLEPEETDPEDIGSEETETEAVTVIPPKGAEYFESQPAHAYVLYSVKDQPDYLLVLEEDGEHYLYRLVTQPETSTETTP